MDPTAVQSYGVKNKETSSWTKPVKSTLVSMDLLGGGGLHAEVAKDVSAIYYITI